MLVTALDQPSDRVAGLEAGADDFLTKPVDDVVLFTRVKSLARLKMLTDELLMRALDRPADGRDRRRCALKRAVGRDGRILVVDDNARSAARLVEWL